MTNIAPHLLRFAEGISPALTYPVKAIPQTRNTLHSPQIGNNNGIKPFDYQRYEEYLDEVIEVRLRCGKNEYPLEFMKKHYPKAWGRLPSEFPKALLDAGINPENTASCEAAVRMDTPVDLGLFIMRDLLARKVLKPKVGTNHTPFLESVPQAIAEMSKRISEALTKCFEVKYYYGVARPAETYKAIKGGDYAAILAYPHPTHPSYAAGHSAASAATAQFFYDYFDLDTSDWIDIRNAAYLFGQFRTMAGVHYAVDNLAGLQVGGLDVGYAIQSV